MTTIACTNCGQPIEVSQALEKEMRRTIEEQLKTQYEKAADLTRKKAEEEIREAFRKEQAFEDRKRESQRLETEARMKKLMEDNLELTKKMRETLARQEAMELTMQKKLLEEEARIRNEARGKAEEEMKLKVAEMAKQLSDARKANEDLTRKLDQRSQQLQGEVLELDLEESLRHAFPYDAIEPVGKGVRGADIRQRVKTPRGNECGVILWESKQTKTWSGEWIGKLKDDLRAEKADIPVIVSVQVPESVKSGFGFVDGVYITIPSLMIPIAELMRARLIERARERFMRENRGSKAEDLYAYVTSTEFRQQLEILSETYREMNEQIAKERVAYEKIWKSRDAQIRRIFSSTARIVGSMSGIVGPSLPSVSGFELLDEPKTTGQTGEDSAG